MRFKNGKKKIGLIALLSCVLTATVAFAAYTGYNYINGTVSVVGSPFKMVYADKNGNPVAETAPGTIAAVGHATVNNVDATEQNVTDGILTDLSVSPFDGTSHAISGFTVKLSKVNDSILYEFKIKNTGGSTAYLDSVSIAESVMPTDSAGESVSGLQYGVGITRDTDQVANFAASSADGELASLAPDGGETSGFISVPPGEVCTVWLLVTATDDSLFTAYDADTETYGATITLGQITITWSAVDPSTGS